MANICVYFLCFSSCRCYPVWSNWPMPSCCVLSTGLPLTEIPHNLKGVINWLSISTNFQISSFIPLGILHTFSSIFFCPLTDWLPLAQCFFNKKKKKSSNPPKKRRAIVWLKQQDYLSFSFRPSSIVMVVEVVLVLVIEIDYWLDLSASWPTIFRCIIEY